MQLSQGALNEIINNRGLRRWHNVQCCEGDATAKCIGRGPVNSSNQENTHSRLQCCMLASRVFLTVTATAQRRLGRSQCSCPEALCTGPNLDSRVCPSGVGRGWGTSRGNLQGVGASNTLITTAPAQDYAQLRHCIRQTLHNCLLMISAMPSRDAMSS